MKHRDPSLPLSGYRKTMPIMAQRHDEQRKARWRNAFLWCMLCAGITLVVASLHCIGGMLP